MTIAIITQPLMSNYGGLLQNWALQKVLHILYPNANIITFDQVDALAPLYLRIGSKIKKFIFNRKSVYRYDKFQKFRDSQILTTTKAKNAKELKRLDRIYKPDVYIVGSDQVWRPSMVMNLENNFLCFTQCKKKVAYAASFGEDRLILNSKQLQQCTKLIKAFTAVSVREKSGVDICNNCFNLEAVHVLDPTLLLEDQDYDNLTEPVDIPKPFTFTYILNSTVHKRTFVENMIGHGTELNALFDYHGNNRQNKLSVGQWLWGLKNSEFVICDSFHGIAFCVIYKKDFYVIDNPQRGSSRIFSILELLGLEDRLVSNSSQVLSLPPIKWDQVYDLLNKNKEYSLKFLNMSII